MEWVSPTQSTNTPLTKDKRLGKLLVPVQLGELRREEERRAERVHCCDPRQVGWTCCLLEKLCRYCPSVKRVAPLSDSGRDRHHREFFLFDHQVSATKNLKSEIQLDFERRCRYVYDVAFCSSGGRTTVSTVKTQKLLFFFLHWTTKSSKSNQFGLIKIVQ